MAVALNVNGLEHSVDMDTSTPLLYVLRNNLQLNAAKYGCGLGQCGACMVLVDSKPIFSCLTPLAAINERRVTTLEGLGTQDKPGLLQRAFEIEQAAQCGYCTAGMIIRAYALLRQTPTPSDADIRAYMQTNLCRCGTHFRVIKAIKLAAQMMKDASAREGAPQ
jgi:nicotinate dehydrogenase subunit A